MSYIFLLGRCIFKLIEWKKEITMFQLPTIFQPFRLPFTSTLWNYDWNKKYVELYVNMKLGYFLLLDFRYIFKFWQKIEYKSFFYMISSLNWNFPSISMSMLFWNRNILFYFMHCTQQWITHRRGKTKKISVNWV